MTDQTPRNLINHSIICIESIEPEWRYQYSIYFNGLLTCLTVVAGCAGNLYSIWAVKRVRISKALCVYLIALALWDTGVLGCAFGYYSLQTLLPLFGIDPTFLLYVTQRLHGPSMTMMTGSVWMVVLITLIRHSAISNPLKHRNAIGSRTRAKRICVAVLILAILYCIPAHFEIFVDHCLTPSDDEHLKPTVQIMPTNLRLNYYYQLIYRLLCFFTLISVLPFFVILALTIHMVVALRRSVTLYLTLTEGRRRLSRLQSMSRHQQIERRTTNMLILMLLKFLSCYTLPVILNIIEAVYGEAVAIQTYFVLLADISNYLVVLNSATNFVVYFLWKQMNTNNQSRITETENMRKTRDSLPIISREETVRLSRLWGNLTKAEGIEQFGSALLVRLLQVKPAFAVHFGIRTDDSFEDQEALSRLPQVRRQGARIGGFLDEMIRTAWEENHAKVRRMVREMARRHYELGINFNTEMWRVFKSYVVWKSLRLRESSFREAIGRPGRADAAVWNKFLSFFVAEMKAAFLAEAARQCADQETTFL